MCLVAAAGVLIPAEGCPQAYFLPEASGLIFTVELPLVVFSGTSNTVEIPPRLVVASHWGTYRVWLLHECECELAL